MASSTGSATKSKVVLSPLMTPLIVYTLIEFRQSRSLQGGRFSHRDEKLVFSRLCMIRCPLSFASVKLFSVLYIPLHSQSKCKPKLDHLILSSISTPLQFYPCLSSMLQWPPQRKPMSKVHGALHLYYLPICLSPHALSPLTASCHLSTFNRLSPAAWGLFFRQLRLGIHILKKNPLILFPLSPIRHCQRRTRFRSRIARGAERMGRGEEGWV